MVWECCQFQGEKISSLGRKGVGVKERERERDIAVLPPAEQTTRLEEAHLKSHPVAHEEPTGFVVRLVSSRTISLPVVAGWRGFALLQPYLGRGFFWDPRGPEPL